jgi:hypothetical protein
MGDAREVAGELRCVAPLVVRAAGGPELAGPCMLVTNGRHAIAVASAEVLRRAGEPLVILTRLDGSSFVPVTAWQLAHDPALGIIDLGEGVAFTPEVHPLHLAQLSAAVETRGAPAALVAVRPVGTAFARALIAVEVVVDDGGGMSDDITRLVMPVEAVGDDVASNGAPLFAWMPPDPVLKRASEVIAIALGVAPRTRGARSGPVVPLAELVGLEDVGRVLPWAEHTPAPQPELVEIAGELGGMTGPVPRMTGDD